MPSKIECFRTRIVVHENNGNRHISYQTKFSKNPLKINPLTMQADPFLFIWNDTLYLFFEEKLLYSNGVLRMISTKDMKKWTAPLTVLQEPFHLSFPNVFVHEREVYMIPETGSAHEVRLYKATDSSLTRFEQEAILLNHDVNTVTDYSDSNIINKDGKYYLMTTVNYNGINELELYISDSLLGPYTQHPQSPVCVDNKYGRNAGPIIYKDDKIYRIAQDCSNGYGENVHILEIANLTPTSYEEHIVKKDLLNRNDDFYREGGHQYCTTQFKGKKVVATDAKSNRILLFQRLLTKLYFKFK